MPKTDGAPAGRPDEVEQDPHRRRLARPVGPQEPEDLALADLEVELDDPAVWTVRLGEALGLDDGCQPGFLRLPATWDARPVAPIVTVRRPENVTASARVRPTTGLGRLLRCLLRSLGSFLEHPQVRFHPAGQRCTRDADEDPRPAIERLERRGVDDPRPAGDRLEAPAPLAVEARRRDAQAEARLGPCLQALDAGRLAEQTQPGAGRPRRRGRRPGWGRGPELELGKERGAGRGVVQRRPDVRGVAWTKTRRSTGPGSDGSIARVARRSLDPRCPRPSLSRRSGARPSSSRGRRRSTRGARTAASSSQSKRDSTTFVGRRRRRLMSSAARSSTSVRRSSGTPHVSSASISA